VSSFSGEPYRVDPSELVISLLKARLETILEKPVGVASSNLT